MGEQAKSPIFSPLAATFMRVVFSIYLLVAFLVTMTHIWVDYHYTKKNVIHNLEVTQKAYGGGLARALWFIDPDHLAVELKGLKEIYEIVGVKIVDDKANMFVAGEVRSRSDDNVSRVFSLGKDWTEIENLTPSAEKLLELKFPLIHVAQDNEIYDVGTATFYTSNSIIWEQLKPKLLIIVVNAIIKTAALGLIILLVGRSLLSKPLSKMTSAAQKIELENLEQIKIEIKSSKKNELTILAEAFNEMVTKLLIARTELYDLNRNLELRIQQRTAELTDANSSLIDSNEKFHSLSMAAFEGISFSKKGILLETNDTFCKMFGYQSSELIDKAVTDLIAPEYREEVQSKILSGYEKTYEIRCLRKDASIFPVEIQAKGFLYKGKQVRVTATRDITERKKAEEEIKALQGILPICSYCKKTRNDKGYWNSVESYISKHTGAELSHGVCPDCIERAYADAGLEPPETD